MEIAAKKPKVIFACNNCGSQYAKWTGKCSECGKYNTVEEETIMPAREGMLGGGTSYPAGKTVLLSQIDSSAMTRIPTGIAEVDRVLGQGEGMVPSTFFLLAGSPGAGKSTMALEIAKAMGTKERPVLYCAGEESANQIALRAKRIGCLGPEIAILSETNIDVIVATIRERKPVLAIIDSIQTVYSLESSGNAPGSPSQLRDAALKIMDVAKTTETSVITIGHVTKEGIVGGPQAIAHYCDCVLYLEGEPHGENRILRAVKNRFGSIDEIGVFTMEEDGLKEVSNPSQMFLDQNTLGMSGNVLTVSCEGSRALTVEIQALVTNTHFPSPRRTASGFDLNRLHLILAVLEKRKKLDFSHKDVYVNVVGGLKISERACDLAVALALYSSLQNMVVSKDMAVIGEIGLSGEVRRVAKMERRIAEAKNLGVKKILIPKITDSLMAKDGIEKKVVQTLEEALNIAFPVVPKAKA